MSIKERILLALSNVGLHGRTILKVTPLTLTDNDYILVYEGIDNRIYKCIINGNEAFNRFDIKYFI